MNELEKKREKIDVLDRQIAELFSVRMETVAQIAEIKRAEGLSVFDKDREDAIIEKNSSYIEKEELVPYYKDFLKNTMRISRSYQQRLLDKQEKRAITVELAERSYDIIIERNSLCRAAELFDLDRKVLIVTDDGVPAKYAETVLAGCGQGVLVTVPQGEQSKSLATLEKLLRLLQENSFTRSDAIVAVGGGVVGDLCGLVASLYQRGIDFYNIPTTLLSQIDSSIGGKTAVNLDGTKNSIGSFYQPKGVLIDPEVLSTLNKRQLASGLAEAIKMAATSDKELFEMLEDCDIEKNVDTVIYRSLMIKKRIVELDEREAGLRRVLNFGHTVGHAIESYNSLHGLLHGECVALGMLWLCSNEVKARLKNLFEKVGLPTETELDKEKIFGYLSHDKKCDGKKIHYVYVEKIGDFEIRTTELSDFSKILEGVI